LSERIALHPSFEMRGWSAQPLCPPLPTCVVQ
jgi:hypothetical protein